MENKKKSPLIYLLLALFFIVAAFAIYYLFFNKPAALYDQQEVALIEKIEDVPPNNDQNISETPDDSEIKETSNVPAIVENKTDNNENTSDETESSKLSSIDNENEVAKNIYFDGYVYNVQISSWKQEQIAQNEVNKLVKSGFPAYKVKVYIPKFDGYWHRVRIGPFTSQQEAAEILKKVNK